MSITHPAEALNLDFKQQRLFVDFFNNLPQKPSSTLRFFSHGDFYTLHSSDATSASTFTGNIVKYMGEDPQLSYVVLRKSQFEQYVRELLLVRQYRVEVYVKSSPNKINDWTLKYKGSPGNLSQFEDVLFENASITFSNDVLGLKVTKGRIIAAASVNSTELKFQVCEFSDNECFTELEALIAQVGPRECVIPQGETPDLIELKKVLERNSVLVARAKKSDFGAENIVQDLNRLLYFAEGHQRSCLSFPETHNSEALTCLNAVIKFLNLTGDEQNFNQFRISSLDVHRYVRLDNAALYSLNILPKPGVNTLESTNQTSKNFSLKGILDHCVTPQGRRLLETWIKQPLKDLNLIQERHEIVETFVKNPQLRQDLQTEVLARLPDLLLLSKKLSSQKATLQDCYKVYQVVAAVPLLLKNLKEVDNPSLQSALIHPIEELRNDLDKYQDMIEELLDLELVDRGEFLVKSSFSPALEEISARKLQIEERMQKLLRAAANDLGFEEEKTIKLDYTDQHRYFFRVTLKEEPVLRSNSRYQILDAVKGGVRFTNSKLAELNDDYAEAKAEYVEQQKTIISEMFAVAAGYGDCLRNLNMFIATVDVLVAFANVAVWARVPYIRPKMFEAGQSPLKLFKVRHPCIEQQEHVSFIPNSVEFDSEHTLHIITGPNMCGKSTYIRSIGVCVLMAQIGSFVPCNYAEIPIVDAILARVGAEDCLLKGLSTFMVEMIETATIIKSATPNSLVIIDELGRGTSTYDGCGLAFAIAEFLAKEIKCFSLFATHFHEITRLAEMHPSVCNKHVTAVTTDNTITPLYQIRDGECDNSYGIHCARMVEFSDDVIQSAVEHQKKLEHTAGMQFLRDFEPVLRRQVVSEGDKIIQDALEKVKRLDKLSDEDLVKEIAKLKEELEGTGNLFIKGLLQ
ncbi:DNA mismatch repair protein Msh2 [Tribolium castaneum]|uniref:DNA mismatch repair protein Msh2 n=1 Tax=Tribolium castaneum TaxID=7070 RepID=UPI0030FE4C3A